MFAHFSSVDHRAGAADAHRRGGELFPGVAAHDAVHRQADVALEGTDRALGVAAEFAVQRVGVVAQGVQRVLQDQHIGGHRAAAQGGIAGGGAGAGGGEIAAVEVHPGGGHRQRLHIAPGAGVAGGVPDLAAVGAGGVLAHVEGHAGVVLTGGAVAALPDALEGVPDVDAAAIAAAGHVPGLHRADGGPQSGRLAAAAELAQAHGAAVDKGHHVVLAELVGEQLVGILIVYE